MLQSNLQHSMIAVQAEKYDPQQSWDDMMQALHEPIPGVTSEERMAQLEGESFDQLMGMLGE